MSRTPKILIARLSALPNDCPLIAQGYGDGYDAYLVWVRPQPRPG